MSVWGTILFTAIAGCSSLSTNSQQRQQMLDAYLAQPQPLILYHSNRLQLDDQLKVLGMGAVAEGLVRQFDRMRAAPGLIHRFVAGSPRLSAAPVRIVSSDQWPALKMRPDTPVLFFLTTWKMHYQRLPPQFNKQRLQLGVIAKIIPLGQVLSGRGSIALRTAAWEGCCLFDAFGGRYFPIDDWLADSAGKMRQGVEESQSACAERLVSAFNVATETASPE